MKIKNILKKVKADRYTFYNLFSQDVSYFRKQYNYLKKHQNKKIDSFWVRRALKELINKNRSSYVNKIKAMETLAGHIQH